MAIYDSEEEQLEALKRWWKENGQASIIGIVAGIAMILGWNYWRDYRHDQAEQASNLYDQYTKALTANQTESAAKIAELIEKDFKNSQYDHFTGLMQAKLKADKGDLPGARELLQSVIAHSDKEVSNVAKLRLIRILLAEGQYEQGLQLLSEIDPASESTFSGSYDELAGDLLVAMDRVDEARTSYEKALRSGHQSPLLKMKLDDLTAPEKIDNQQ